ncbi:hypothetical protein E6H35_08320 [Candidatus Bathyarchaeota archaeon]|nr:MAG: hypothetical protein E6H35_08320 [Candidatus Bathyarchaeota archaeon]
MKGRVSTFTRRLPVLPSFVAWSSPRPLVVFVYVPVHLNTIQVLKDEELRTLLRKRGYRILELSYSSYSDRKRDELYREIMSGLGK